MTNLRSALVAATALSVGLVGSVAQAQTVAISGAGASFPNPVFQIWFDTYSTSVDPNVQVSYQSVGSGAGLEQYIAGTVDFGASEAPMNADNNTARYESFLAAYEYEPLQLPVVGGAVVFAHNIPDIGDGELQLRRETYCGIVTGEIDNWSDIRIKAENPSLTMPDLPITFVHRSDGSGTTFVFTNHVNAVCEGWEGGVGTSVEWPQTGGFIGGEGNEGVAANIAAEEGSIGYVNQAYAVLEEMNTIAIENAAGNYVAATLENASSALDTEIPEDFALLVPDPQGAEDYPIVGLAWVMVYRNYEDPAKLEALRELLKWTQSAEGNALAEELNYVVMPASVVERINAELDAITAN
ncbi:MAG: phosphate ABC transporter substrate-binding protein PstS [Synechococcaceae cyanobacterium SM2_3_2]|nr:phosphate ABC transporter substrate-binding protein PstS [Synechococcaceae cyanobacterium SM2_3_2]